MTVPGKHPGLTKAQFAYLGRYIRECANDMGLWDWTLTLSYEPPAQMWPDDTEKASSAIATCKATYGRRVAVIGVAEDFMDFDPETQRMAIVHELLHCHTDDIDSLCHEALPDLLGKPTYEAWWSGFALALEHLVDGIAMSWAEKMPVPKWPGKKPSNVQHRVRLPHK